MGLVPTKNFVLSAILVSLCITLGLGYDQGIVTEAVPPIPPLHQHGPHYHGPVISPSLAPSHHHHHHNHHHSHPPSASPLAQPPMHHHHHSKPHVHPPSHAPVHPPSHAPVVPVHPPVKPPVHPPYPLPKRNFVAVQGVVYCKPCKFRGVTTLLGAAPLSGAAVKLQCNNTKYPLVTKATTDKNGYFLIKAPKTITTYGAHKCKVSLVFSPLRTCNQPTDLHGGVSGSMLWLDKKGVAGDVPFALYTVGPFAFEPAKAVNCTS